MRKIVYLLAISDSTSALPELAASIIARCCETAKHQHAFENIGAVEAVLELLILSNNNSRTKEACLDALSAFLRQNLKVAQSLISKHALNNVSHLAHVLLVICCECLRFLGHCLARRPA